MRDEVPEDGKKVREEIAIKLKEAAARAGYLSPDPGGDAMNVKWPDEDVAEAS